jgi:hypothetical protein
MCGNLDLRAYREAGMSCLGIKETKPGGGNVLLFVHPGEKASGLSLKVKGTNSGARLLVLLTAGDVWKYEIKDDFAGWRQFDIYRESMSPAGAGTTWGATTRIELGVFPGIDREMSIADLHLLPARTGDFIGKADG